MHEESTVAWVANVQELFKVESICASRGTPTFTKNFITFGAPWHQILYYYTAGRFCWPCLLRGLSLFELNNNSGLWRVLSSSTAAAVSKLFLASLAPVNLNKFACSLPPEM